MAICVGHKTVKQTIHSKFTSEEITIHVSDCLRVIGMDEGRMLNEYASASQKHCRL